MTKEGSEISHMVQKAEEYLKKFDDRELVTTPEAGKKKFSFNGVVIKSSGVFADLLSRIITMYRATREENPLKVMFSYDLVLIFDLGIAHRLIVPGDMVFRKLREYEEKIEQLSEQIEELRVENMLLKEEIQKLMFRRDNFIEP